MAYTNISTITGREIKKKKKSVVSAASSAVKKTASSTAAKTTGSKKKTYTNVSSTTGRGTSKAARKQTAKSMAKARAAKPKKTTAKTTVGSHTRISSNTGRATDIKGRQQTAKRYANLNRAKANAKNRVNAVSRGHTALADHRVIGKKMPTLSMEDQYLLNDKGRNDVEYSKFLWDAARKNNDPAGMRLAHSMAELARLRNPQAVVGEGEVTGPYSGGTWGDRALEASQTDMKPLEKSFGASERYAVESALYGALGGNLKSLVYFPASLPEGQTASNLVIPTPGGKFSRNPVERRGQSFYTEEDVSNKADEYMNLSEAALQTAYEKTPIENGAGKFIVDATKVGTEVGMDALLMAATKNPNVALASMGSRVWGQSVEQAKEDMKYKGSEGQPNADLKAYMYGTAVAGTEVLSEKLLGGVKIGGKLLYGKGIFGGKFFKDMGSAIDGGIARAAARVGKTKGGEIAWRNLLEMGRSGFEEGLEEVFADLVQWKLPSLIYSGDSEGAKELISNMLYDFALGGAMGGLGGVTSIPSVARETQRDIILRQKDDLDVRLQDLGLSEENANLVKDNVQFEELVMLEEAEDEQIRNWAIEKAARLRKIKSEEAEVGISAQREALRDRLVGLGYDEAEAENASNRNEAKVTGYLATEATEDEVREWFEDGVIPDMGEYVNPLEQAAREMAGVQTEAPAAVQEEAPAESTGNVSMAKAKKDLRRRLREAEVKDEGQIKAIMNGMTAEEMAEVAGLRKNDFLEWRDRVMSQEYQEEEEDVEEEVTDVFNGEEITGETENEVQLSAQALQQQNEAMREQAREEAESAQETTEAPAQPQTTATNPILEGMSRTFGVEGRRAFFSMYKAEEKQDPVHYSYEMARAYNQGFGGARLDTMLNRTITREQADAAYNAGRMDSMRSMASQKKNTNRSIIFKKNVAGLFRDEYVEKNISKEEADYIDEIAKALRVKVFFASSVGGLDRYGESAANGLYEKGVVLVASDITRGREATAFVVGHEFTHRMKDLDVKAYRNLEKYVMSLKDANERIVKMEQKYADAQMSITHEGAIEEVVADYVGEMIRDHNLLQKFAEQANRNTLQRFLDVLRKIKESIFGKKGKGSQTLNRDLDHAIGLIETMLSKSEKSAKKLERKKLNVVDESVLSEEYLYDSDTGKRYSIKAMRLDSDEGIMYRDLISAGVFTKADADKLKKNIDDMVKFMAEFAHIVDQQEGYVRENRPYSALKPNSDPLYKLSLDFTTMCRKRILAQAIVEKIQTHEGKAMSSDRQMKLRNLLKQYQEMDNAALVACGMCYVEAARYKSPKAINKFLKKPDDIVIKYFANKDKAYKEVIKKAGEDFKVSKGYAPDETKKNMSSDHVKALNAELDKKRREYRKHMKPEETALLEKIKGMDPNIFLTENSLTQLLIDEPVIYDIFISFVRMATRSKAVQGSVPYYYGDSRAALSDKMIQNMNAENGLRFQSWSDWQIQHALDLMTAVIDLSVRGVKMHGYTKFPEMIRVFGNTNMQFNMSGILGTVDPIIENGEYSKKNFDNVEGVNIDEAIKVRDEFPETAGIECIGVSEKQIRALLRTDWIDYVIPYHASGLNKALRKIAKIEDWHDFTKVQEAHPINKDAKPGPNDDAANWHKEPQFSEFMVWEGVDGLDCMRKSAERYKELCRQRGMTPKFESLMDEPNYWKLLIDRKMINQKTGALIIQKPVVPVFDFKALEMEVMRAVDEYNPDRIDAAFKYIVEHASDQHLKFDNKMKEEAAAIPNTVYANMVGTKEQKLSLRETEYEEAIKNGDVATQQRLVDKAALDAGYIPKRLYHGTDSHGFTWFDVSKMDDGRSIFLASDPVISASYTENRGIGTPGGRGDEYGHELVNGRRPRSAREMDLEEVVELYNESQDDNFEIFSENDLKGFFDSEMYKIKDIGNSARSTLLFGYYYVGSYSRQKITLNEDEKSFLDIIKRLSDAKTLEDVLAVQDEAKSVYKSDPEKYMGIWHRTGFSDNIDYYSEHLESVSNLLEDASKGTRFVGTGFYDLMTEEDFRFNYGDEVDEERFGIYALYAKYSNPLVINAGGEYWNEIHFWPDDMMEISKRREAALDRGDEEEAARLMKQFDDIESELYAKYGFDRHEATTRQISEYAKDRGYDAVIFRDLIDVGPYGGTVSTGDIYVLFDGRRTKSADPITYDDNGNVIPLGERFNDNKNEMRYSLREVDPVVPSSNKWKRGATYDEVKAVHPTLFELKADESEARNPTQVKNTVNTYRKIYRLLEDEGFNGTILDASSGLGVGTIAGREEFGFNVEDIEPFPDKSYNPMYTDYQVLNKQYDVVISNAVLNVLPQDLRDNMIVKIGELLAPGGRAYINVRGTDVESSTGKIPIDADQIEYFIPGNGSYQKGFRKAELIAYLKDALGSRFQVMPANNFGNISAIVTRKDSDSRYSLRARDAQYMDAVKANDMETAQRMVDEAAEAAGYTIKAYHGTANGGKFTIFDPKKLNNSKMSSHIGQGFYFTNSREGAQEYTKNMDAYGKVTKGSNPNLFEGYIRLQNPIEITNNSHVLTLMQIRNIVSDGNKKWFFESGIAHELQNKDIGGESYTKDEIKAMDIEKRIDLYSRYLYRFGDMAALSNMVDAYAFDSQDDLLLSIQYHTGYDGIHWEQKKGLDQFVVFDSSQFKDSSPVTYGDSGNVIPLSERFNEGKNDIRYSLRERVFNGTVVLEESTVDSYLQAYAAQSSPNYAQAYITHMSPKQFLDLTTTIVGRARINKESTPLDTDNLAEATRHQPFHLIIDHDTQEVTGHEGRHRMVALSREGVNTVPVLVFDYANKYSKKPMDGLVLHGQDFGHDRSHGTVVAHDVLPFSYANRDEIIKRFATQPTNERIAENYGNETVRYSIRGVPVYDEMVAQYGAIPPGERPARDVKVPRKTAEDLNVYQTIRTVMEAGTTTDAILPTLQEMVASGEFSYKTFGDKEAVDNGRRELAEKGFDQLYGSWEATIESGKVNKQLTATGFVLYEYAAQNDRPVDACHIIHLLTKHQNNAAQALQATRILKQFSPEIRMQEIKRRTKDDDNMSPEVRDKINEYDDGTEQDYEGGYEDTGTDTGKAPRKPRKQGRRTESETGETGERETAPRRPKKKPTQEDVDNVEKEIAKDEIRRNKSNFRDMWNAWRYLAMLLNFRTHIRNFGGNMFFAPIVVAKNATATAAEIAIYHTVGKNHGMKRTKGFYNPKMFAFAWGDFVKMRPTIMGEIKYEGQNYDPEEKIFRGFLAPLEGPRKFNAALLNAEDAAFSRPHYANALAQYMGANHITVEMMETGSGIIKGGPLDGQHFTQEIMDEARAYAVLEAQKATYRDTNDLSNFFMHVGRPKDKKNKVEKVIYVLIEGVIPFRKTPANILCRAMEYSPVGLAHGLKRLIYDVPMSYKINQKKERGEKLTDKELNFEQVTVAEALDRICSGLTGSAIFALGMYLAKMGILVAKNDDGDDEQKYFNDLLGHQDWALEIGDTSITIDWLAPEAVPLFMGAQYWTGFREGDPIRNFTGMASAMSMVIDPVLELSCMSGVQELLQNSARFSEGDLNTMVGMAATLGLSYLSQGIPTLFGQLERVSQADRMRTFTQDEQLIPADWQYQIGKLSAKIPGWDYHQIPYVDSWGNTETETSFWKRVVANMFNPAYVKKIDTRDVNKELQRLYDATGDGKVLPDPGWKTYRYTDENGKAQTVYLNETEYLTYGRAKGRNQFELVSKFLKSGAYKNMSDPDRANVLHDIYYYSEYKAQTDYIPNFKGEPYSWVSNYENFSNKVGGYDVSDYIIVRNATRDVKGLYDPNKPGSNAISGTSACAKVLAIYNSGVHVPSEPEKHEAFMEALEVAKTYRGYNKAMAEEFLANTKQKYGI